MLEDLSGGAACLRCTQGWWEPLARGLSLSHAKSFACQQVTSSTGPHTPARQARALLVGPDVVCIAADSTRCLRSATPVSPQHTATEQTSNSIMGLRSFDTSHFPPLSPCLTGWLHKQETGHKCAQQGSRTQMISSVYLHFRRKGAS